MSNSVLVYAVAAMLFWAPAALLLHRRMSQMKLVEQVAAGLMVALGWPLTMPLLGWSRIGRHT
jgi:hypothetical protein